MMVMAVMGKMDSARGSTGRSRTRRVGRVWRAVWVLIAVIGAGPVWAGKQIYEPLAQSVRSAMAAAVLDGAPPEPRFVSSLEKVNWLAQMSGRLPRRHAPTLSERVEFLQRVRYEAQRAGLDPHLVLGLIQVESGFRRHAISSSGARGYMQVMPFWTRLIGDGNPAVLFDAQTNLRYGCTILRHYLDIERGDLFRALGRYNGSLGRPEYPQAVLAAWRRWAYVPDATPPIQASAGDATPARSDSGRLDPTAKSESMVAMPAGRAPFQGS